MFWQNNKSKTKGAKGGESKWCVILLKPNPDVKDQITEKLKEAFLLTDDFVGEVFANCPVNLVDHLTKENALRLKEYFQKAGAELTVTNDRAVKMKHFCIKWQEAPNLDFLPEISAKDTPLELSFHSTKETPASYPIPKIVEEPASQKKTPSWDFQQLEKDIEQTLAAASRVPEKISSTPAKSNHELEDKISDLTLELGSSQIEISQLKEEAKQLTEAKTDFARLLLESRKELESAQIRITELEALRGDETKVFETLKAQYQLATAQLEDYRTKSAPLQDEIRGLMQLKNILEKSLIECQNSLDKQQALLTSMEAEKAELKSLWQNIRKQNR